MRKKFLFITLLLMSLLYTGCEDTCSKELIEIVKSPNGKYEIRTYLRNCGALSAWELIADLCDTSNGKCKEIYYFYRESDSFVYWIDDENVFINQRTLNIFKDKYHCHICYDPEFHLYGGMVSKDIYLIDKNGSDYKLSGTNVYYIDEYGKDIFNFDKANIYDDYDFIMKVVDNYIEDGGVDESGEYFLKIDNNKMYLINDDKMSELNRTDYEYLKKILVSNNLYDFS